MNELKTLWKLFKQLINYSDFYISRWLRGFVERPTKVFKMLRPKSFDESIFVFMELTERHAELRAILDIHQVSRDFVTAMHHGMGQQIRNEWKLWVPKSDLFKDMADKFNLFHADDMSSVILQTGWQRYHGFPETPNIFAMGYIWYWNDSYKRGEWDGQFDGGKIYPVEIPAQMRASIKMEKLKMEVFGEAQKAREVEAGIESIIDKSKK